MAAVSQVIQRLDAFRVHLGEISRGGSTFDFQPDEATRAAMAKTLGLVALPSFSAKLDLALWLEGAEITGAWNGIVIQTCGVSLEDFETPLAGAFTVRVLPQDSPNAPTPGAEVDLDAEGDDPPDVLDGDVIDLGAYVVEHLGLDLDPFPRKPGAVFEAPEAAAIISPFASLRDLKS